MISATCVYLDAVNALCEDDFLTTWKLTMTLKMRRDWHYYAFAIGLIFILNGVLGLLGFEPQGWQRYAAGLASWVVGFWLAGFIIRRPSAAANDSD